MAGQSDNLENLVRQVVSHPCFQDAVNSASQHIDASSSTSSENITPGDKQIYFCEFGSFNSSCTCDCCEF